MLQSESVTALEPGITYDPRTRLLLEAPITGTLLRLAAPNVLVMVVQASVGLIETYFISRLGTDALAGVALVFPIVMLMTNDVGRRHGWGTHAPLSPARSALDAGPMPTRWRSMRSPSQWSLGSFYARHAGGRLILAV